MKAAKINDGDYVREQDVASLHHGSASIRSKKMGYDFNVPLLAGDHVTEDTGTGFVHTAPGHGREDFDIWMANARANDARGINTAIPYTVDDDGRFTRCRAGFPGQRVINDKAKGGPTTR